MTGMKPALVLPGWLPQPVANYVRLIVANERRDRNSDEVLQRLTSDPRMQRVWGELQKRKRDPDYKSTEAFMYSATSSENWSEGARAAIRRSQKLIKIGGQSNQREAKRLELIARLSEFKETDMLFPWHVGRKELPRQDLALVFFLQQALELSRQFRRPVTRAEARKKRQHYLDMARRIRDDVELDPSYSSTQEILLNAAFAYDELADQAGPSDGNPLLVDRKRKGDERQNGFVIRFAAMTKAVFGSPLYGVVATVANVAFNCEVWTDLKVRKLAAHTLPLTQKASGH
jgi:hypothetical protein